MSGKVKKKEKNKKEKEKKKNVFGMVKLRKIKEAKEGGRRDLRVKEHEKGTKTKE